MIRCPPRPRFFPYTTLFRSVNFVGVDFRSGLARTPDMGPLFGILRSILSEPTVGTVSITAVDILRAEVLYRKTDSRSEEHTSELQSRQYLVCRLLLEKKKTN